MGKAIVWFRNDLRLADNPALAAALAAGHEPVPVYVHSPEEEGEWAPGAASNAWRHRSLQGLQQSLRERGSDLVIRRGAAFDVLHALAKETGAEAIHWNRRHEPAVASRDADLLAGLREAGLVVRTFRAGQLSDPWDLLSGQGTPYKVFTPYWRALQPRLNLPPWSPAPASLPPVDPHIVSLPLVALGLAPVVGWDAGFWKQQVPGEGGAHETLDTFIEGALQGYGEQRDLPDRTGTSLLSAHLHFGEIAPWTVIQRLRMARTAANSTDIDAWIRQLGWREFASYTLHHFPDSAGTDLNVRFRRMRWNPPDAHFLAQWQQGRTGVPIVDAGLRQLWQTGWMHNRVRLIVGSWLTKHMRVHWLHGARWFWDTLIDADLANNTLGWQWVAGTGTDASPYFRIFNPVIQARKFDPHARYIAQWVPELRPLPPEARFAPWEHGGASGYPARPNVDLTKGRDAALAAWRRTR